MSNGSSNWPFIVALLLSFFVVADADDDVAPKATYPPTDTLFHRLPPALPLEHDIDAWSQAHGFTTSNADLRARLSKLAESGDPARLPAMLLAHREPYRLPAHLDAIADQLRVRPTSRVSDTLAQLSIGIAYGLGVPSSRIATRGSVPEDRDLDAFIDVLILCAEEARSAVGHALAGLSEDDREFVRRNWQGLTARLREHIYLYDDPDLERRAANQRLMELGQRVDLASLIDAARLVSGLADPDFLAALRAAVDAAGLDATQRIVFDQSLEHGRLVISGTGNDVFTDGDVLIHIDLGGDDFYANSAGSTVHEAKERKIAIERSVSILIDAAGDDAYECTHEGSIACGVLGLGMVIDVAGDDRYLGTCCSQGFGLMGLGMLFDLAGNDRYRVGQLGQSVALWGASLLFDGAGDDRYEATLYAQALGMSRGFAALVDLDGDDEYYSKGRRPTVYGDAGRFDSWSQGVGLGFRRQVSGGIGMLLDHAGHDIYEAGAFSQGGGYYYAIGALLDDAGSDQYIGSRYDQGWSAHQAAGYFREQGGNDRYSTRHIVIAGLAWDQSVSFFLELGGDDEYRAGGFSLGASAHNALCVFYDRSGNDRYLYPKLAEVSSNDYHGGTSLSIFVDDGHGVDEYRGGQSNDSTMPVEAGKSGGHGLFVDR